MDLIIVRNVSTIVTITRLFKVRINHIEAVITYDIIANKIKTGHIKV
jgi:hypothetical protein